MNLHLLLLSAILATACNQTEIKQSTAQGPLIRLEFSPSPIDLEGINAKYAADVPYDDFEHTTFDIFIPRSTIPTGLVVFIHGGGFRGGDKSFIYAKLFPASIREILRANIAVATINYRLLNEAGTEGVLKCLYDSKRAIQYMRYIHKELNIQKGRIALYGSSAGAGTSLWIATNDDLKDLSSADPILRESTRVKGIALSATQASYDIEHRWVNDVLSDFHISWETFKTTDAERLFHFYGVSSWEEYDSPEIDEYRKQIDMLSLLSSDDPEIWASNGGPNGIPTTTGQINHHPFHVREIKEYADAVGVKNSCRYGDPVLFESDNMETFTKFLIRKVKE